MDLIVDVLHVLVGVQKRKKTFFFWKWPARPMPVDSKFGRLLMTTLNKFLRRPQVWKLKQKS
jgi:hypothetical protein